MTLVLLVGSFIVLENCACGKQKWFILFFWAAGQPPHTYFSRRIRETDLELLSRLWNICVCFDLIMMLK